MKKILLLAALALIGIAHAQLQQAPSRISRTAAQGQLPYHPLLKPFYHGVASGDPLADRVILWTRVTPETDQVIQVDWTVATDTSFHHIVRSGTVTTDISKDYTVKVDVTGLAANTTYYYYFTALGSRSLTGRTKTAPDGDNLQEVLKFAVVSCANYEAGFFNAYTRIAARNDLNAILFLGDYIYEYKTGTYRDDAISDPERTFLPAGELLTEADYRTRYSLYRLDRDLIRAHQQHPFIAIWDDHEYANNAYNTGAENHTEGTEGAWSNRKAISRKVYYEWMPVRDNGDDHLYRKISYGSLADLILLDTRMDDRDRQPAHFDSPEIYTNHIMSPAQFQWFTGQLKSSQARWKIIGNQVLFSTFNIGFGATDGQEQPAPTDYNAVRAAEDHFLDHWEGYTGQRNNVIDTLKKYGVNNVLFVTGDSHCSWAFDVTKKAVLYPEAAYNNIPQPNPYNNASGEGYDPATGAGSYAVELGTPSISSQNFDEVYGSDKTALTESYINQPIPMLNNANYNPHLKYADLDRHGYFILDLRAGAAQADYFYVPSVTSVTATEEWGRGIATGSNANHITSSAVSNAAPPKSQQDIPAPGPLTITGAASGAAGQIFTLYPNPADNVFMLSFGLITEADLSIFITDMQGKMVKTLAWSAGMASGIYQMDYNISDIAPGIYLLHIETSRGRMSRKLTVK